MADNKAVKLAKIVKEQNEPYDSFNRFEIIDNVRYDLKPAPTVIHQKISSYLYRSLYNSCHLKGTILYAPLDVYLDDENLFQPDLIFVSNENSDIIMDQYIEGSPDLVVEILSPSTSQNDKIRKKALYERFGVKEYWIVDPHHFTIDQFVLENGKYQLNGTYADGHTLSSEKFPCIEVDLSSLFKSIRRFSP
jgi:Uma2 family endonuclease